jgi:hypothetical protein
MRSAPKRQKVSSSTAGTGLQVNHFAPCCMHVFTVNAEFHVVAGPVDDGWFPRTALAAR